MAASTSRETSNEVEEKICSVVDYIGGSDYFCIESNRISEEYVICAVSNGSERVYLYENGRKKTTLQFPSYCVVCHSYVDSEDYYFLCGLADGSLYAYKIAEGVGQEKKKKKKKKKMKHKDKGKEETRNESKPTNGITESDIFADLLGNHGNVNQDQTTSSKQDHPSGEDSQMAQVTVVGAEMAILKEEHLQDFFVVNDCLVTCAELESGWTISVYQWRLKSLPARGNGGENDVGGIPGCQKSPVYRTYFPKLNSSTQSTNSIGCFEVFDHGIDQSGIEVDQTSSRKPCMKCLLSSSTQVRRESGSTPKKLIIVGDVLFNDLFGCESNLLDSPVVLLGLPDGRVYKVHLKSLRNFGEGNGESTVTKINSMVDGFTGNLFYNLKDVVINFHALHDGTEAKGSQCLLLLGSQGKVVTISHCKKETSKQFDEHSVAGPVISSCSMASHVVYSSERAVFALSMKKRSETKPDRTGKCAIEKIAVEVGGVCAMDVLKATDACIQLVAAMGNGKIVVLNIPLLSQHGNGQSQPIMGKAAGQRMKDLPHAINNVSTRMQQLSLVSANQNKVIEEINKACHLAGWLLDGHFVSHHASGNHFVSHDASPFPTKVQYIFKNEGSQCYRELQCKVTNNSGLLLSNGWSLIVSVKGQRDWPVQDGVESCVQITRSVQLDNFEPGKTVTVYVDLNTSISLQLPLDVTFHLYFNLSDFIDNLTSNRKLFAGSKRAELNTSGAVLTFVHKTVDIFMVLRPVGENSIRATCNTGCDWLAKALETAADGRLTNRKSCIGGARMSAGSVSTVVLFKDDVIEALRKDLNTGNDINPQFCVLQWLFRHNPALLQTINGNQLETITTDGKRISFISVQKGQGSESKDVELTMMAPDYESVCQLQKSVHRNLKEIFHKHDNKDLTIPRSQLQNQLRHLQSLQKKLESVEDGFVSTNGATTAGSSVLQTGQESLEVYHLMRNTDTSLF